MTKMKWSARGRRGRGRRLKGAALVIARLWLDKARKRRAFTRHIQGLMLAQKRDACDLTGRTEAMGAKLVCTLATNGKPDKNAIDDLIAGFEEAYGPNEADVNLWKAYFRATPSSSRWIRLY